MYVIYNYTSRHIEYAGNILLFFFLIGICNNKKPLEMASVDT